MKALTKRIFAVAGVLALGVTAVKAQSDGALLNALVTKGVLSDQEAEDIRANEAKDYAQTPAGKLSISNHVTQLKLYGDARMRFEYLDEKPQNKSAAVAANGFGSDSSTTERNRYRIRVGADYTFTDNFTAGFELESATASDSANQTMGAEYQKFGINVGLVYLQYKPTDWITLTGGKQRNPLYTTDLEWDPDINPEGGSEVASWTIPIDFGSDAPASSDPKAIVAPAEPSTYLLTIGLTGGQFIYADNSEANPTTTAAGTPLPKTDIWQFVEQVPIQFNFDKDTFIKEVPGFNSLTGGGTSGGGGPNGVGGVGTNTGSVNFQGPHAADHLQIFTAPGEVDWKLWDLPFRAYWDFALNLQGKERIQDVYLSNNTTGGAPDAAQVAVQQQNQGLGDNVAWLAGLQVGQNKKKGDWSIKGDFRQVGLGAIDPNTNDSDFGDSFLNQQGFKIQSVYNFTDFVTGSLTFFDTWAYKSGLLNGTTPGQNSGNSATLPIQSGGGSTVAGGTIGAAGATNVTDSLVGIHSSQRVQVDLVWKF